MQGSILNSQDNLRDVADVYLSKWKYILLVVFVSFFVAWLYLRYSTYEYKISASIQIKNEESSNQLPEISSLQNYGLFSADFSKVEDEIQVLKSRHLIEEMAKELDLNIKFFVQGRFKDKEIYTNPPLNLNFFESDSVIHRVDTTLYVNILSATEFELGGETDGSWFGSSGGEARKYSFGDKITTGFGDLVITPNEEAYGSAPGSLVKIQLEKLENIVEDYLLKINVQSGINSNILKLSLNEGIPRKGELILNELIRQYNKDVINDKNEIVRITSEFINNRLDVVSTELEQVDLTAESLKKSNRLSDIASQSSIFLQSEKENEAKLIAANNQLQLIEYMSDYVSSNDSDSDLLPANVGINDQTVAQTTQSYNALVLERDRILRNSSEKNPTVVNLNNQINALKSNLDQSLRNLKSSTQITIGNLNKEDARISSQIYATPQKERQFRDITRQQSIKESLYLYLLEKREETAISLGMSSPNAKIIDEAYSSTFPISPRRRFVYLAALVLGLLLPTAFIFFGTLLDTKVHTRKDVARYVDAPFIGDIPRSSSKKSRRIISKVDYSPKAEAFRMVRTNIDFMLKGKGDGARTIFVTSTTAQEGKSHTSVNLATSISYSEKKVLLIETDIRVPKVEDYLGVPNNKGFTDYVSDPNMKVESVIHKVKDNPYLHVLPSGTIPPNPAELMMSPRVKEIFELVKDRYEYIIVDTAAVGLVTDTLLISDFADLFVYVVSAEKLDKRQLHVARSMYEEKRLPNMAILLNGSKKRSGYGYGYGYGSGPKKKWYEFYKA